MSRHRIRARRNIRLAQISALGLVCLAGLLAAMPAPPVVTAAAPLPPSGSDSTATVGGVQQVDFNTVLDVLNNRVRRTEPVVQAIPASDLATTEETGESGAPVDVPMIEGGPPHFRFIGMVSSPRRNYAFVAAPDGTTRTIAQGEYYDDQHEYLVLGISSERIVLADCDDNRHDYFLVDRLESPNVDGAVNLGAAPPGGNPAVTTGEAAKFEHDVMRRTYPNTTDPSDRERQDERLREIEERRKMALKGTAGIPPQGNAPQQAPPRPAAVPQPRPGTPANKNAPNNKDVK